MRILKGKKHFRDNFMLSLKIIQHKKNQKLHKSEVKFDFCKRNSANFKNK